MRRVALGRGAVAAGAGGLDHDRLGAREPVLSALVGELRLVPARAAQQEPPRCARLAAEHAPRPVAEAFADAVEDAVVIDRAHHPAQSHAAAVAARSAGVLHQAVLLHAQRILLLDRLHRQVRGVRDVDLHAVLAVLDGPPTHSPAEGLEVEVAAAVARVDAREHRGGVGAVRGPDDPVGQRLAERPDHHVDDALAGMRARRDRGREAAVHQGSRLGVDVRDREHALIVRHLRVEHRLQRVAHRRLRRVHGDVDVALHLRTRAGEVEVRAVARDGHPQPDGNVHRLDAVAVHHVLERVHAVRDAGDGLAQPPLGAGDDLVEGGADDGGGVEIDHFQEAPGAEPARRDLRVVVPAALLGHPHVEQQQIHDVALQLALAEQPDHRDAQALLEDLAHAPRHRPGSHAADVRVVREVRDEAEQLAADEHRHRVVDVREVGAARGMRIVGDEEIAFVDVARELLEQAGNEPAHRRDVDRQRLG